jgi:hypothetical protein
VDEHIAPSLPNNGDRDPEERSLGSFVLVAIRAIVRVSFEVSSVFFYFAVPVFFPSGFPLGASVRNHNGGRQEII